VGKESFSDIFKRFRIRMNSLLESIKEKWKNILSKGIWAGITAFLSNILIFVINLFATTLKKIVSMIRAGFVSLVEAIKILANPPENMDRDEVNYQAFKILVAGLIGATSLGLSAGIEKLLQSIPGLQPFMMFPIPFIGKEPRTVSDILAVTLSALAGGLVTTIVLYFMDKLQSKSKKDKIQLQILNQAGTVLNYKIAQTWTVMSNAYTFFGIQVEKTNETGIKTKENLDKMHSDTMKELSRVDTLLDDLNKKKEEHQNLYKETEEF
jgi:phage-related minor tail protein